MLRYVSISVGVSAMIPGAKDEPTVLIEKSQRHLKLAKQSGRNQAA